MNNLPIDTISEIHTPETITAMDDNALVHYFGDLKTDSWNIADAGEEIPDEIYTAYELVEAELFRRLAFRHQ